MLSAGERKSSRVRRTRNTSLMTFQWQCSSSSGQMSNFLYYHYNKTMNKRNDQQLKEFFQVHRVISIDIETSVLYVFCADFFLLKRKTDKREDDRPSRERERSVCQMSIFRHWWETYDDDVPFYNNKKKFECLCISYLLSPSSSLG